MGQGGEDRVEGRKEGQREMRSERYTRQENQLFQNKVYLQRSCPLYTNKLET